MLLAEKLKEAAGRYVAMSLIQGESGPSVVCELVMHLGAREFELFLPGGFL